SRAHGHIGPGRARLLLGSEPDAQEALQEVFASLLRAPQSLRNAASVVGWLYQATTHFCLNLLRNQRTGARLLQARPAPALAAGSRGGAVAELRSPPPRRPSAAAARACRAPT